MIDLASEHVVPLTEAGQHLPALHGGRRPHISTLHRWATVGFHGVRLETIKVGAARCTSREALQRFVERLTEATAQE